MIITKERLIELNACPEGVEYFESLNETDLLKIADRLETSEQWGYANWLLPKLLNPENCVKYAVFAAEMVLPIFEEIYPNDGRPRRAIEMVKNTQLSAAEAARSAAYAAEAARSAAYAAYAAYAAAYAARGAAEAARGAAEAARSAAEAARSAASAAARGAAYAASAAAYAAACAAEAARGAAADATKIEILQKIVRYGLNIIINQQKELLCQ